MVCRSVVKLKLEYVNMRKSLLICVLVLLCVSPVFAGQHRSVPLGHRVYPVIRSAELRGLIPHQISVKPYSASKVVSLLEEVKSQPEKLTEAELTKLDVLIDELTYSYETEDFLHMLRQGSYRSYNENLNIGVSLGAAADSQLTLPVGDTDHYDLRNSLRVVLRGDILDFASIYMDFGVRYDILDNRAFIESDFTIPGEGFYFNPLLGAATLENIPSEDKETYNVSVDYFPEISLSFLDHALQFRFGHINRDWGVGSENSLQLSGTARPFDGIEGQIEFTDWMRYSFIVGSLGVFSLNQLGDRDFFSDHLRDRDDYRFSNNFSAKRAEADLPGNFTFGIFESCVWPKRFEIGYLNPFGILMFQQNQQGDLDNMLAGVDLQWRLPGVLRLHGTWATTEMNETSPSRFLQEPRNIMGFQAGADISLPAGVFSNLSFQYTHLGPFFYTHYVHEDGHLPLMYRGGIREKCEECDGENDNCGNCEDGWIYIPNKLETAYVNKGENLGYSLNPNSDEFLLQTHIGLSSGWESVLRLRYQRRSGQYGFRIDEPMDYSKQDEYEDVDFFGNIFERTLSCELGLSKTFSSFPLRLFGSYQYSMNMRRERETEIGEDINHTYDDSWSDPKHNHVIQVGFEVFK